jgi:hypothetical protein
VQNHFHIPEQLAADFYTTASTASVKRYSSAYTPSAGGNLTAAPVVTSSTITLQVHLVNGRNYCRDVIDLLSLCQILASIPASKGAIGSTATVYDEKLTQVSTATGFAKRVCDGTVTFNSGLDLTVEMCMADMSYTRSLANSQRRSPVASSRALYHRAKTSLANTDMAGIAGSTMLASEGLPDSGCGAWW